MIKKKKKKKKIVKILNLTIPKDYRLEDVGMTQGLLKTFQTCRRKFLFKINRYESKIKKTTTSFGNVVHDLLKQYYTKGKYNIESYDYSETGWDAQEIEFQKAKIDVVLEVYEKAYPYNSNFESIEEVFEVGFKENFFPYWIAKIKTDALILSSENWLVDHKTMSRVLSENDLENKLALDPQMHFYIYVLEEYFKQKFSGFIYNIIRNPQMKLGSSESLKQFKSRLLQGVHKDPEHYFKRYEVPVTEKEKAEFKIELYHKLIDVQRILSGDLEIYKSEGACYDQYPCEFLRTCTLGNMSLCKKQKVFFPELED